MKTLDTTTTSPAALGAAIAWKTDDLQRLAKPAHRPAPTQAVSSEEIDFVHDARLLLKHRHRRARRWFPWVALLASGTFIWWASWAEIDEVTRGIGKVIPSKSVQIIQSLEGGILEELLVEEGQTVEIGQNLARIRDAIFASNYQENLSRQQVLEARLARLKAEASHLDKITFPNGVRPELSALEESFFAKRRSDLLTTEAALDGRLRLARMEEDLLRAGTTSKAVSPVEHIRAQKEIAQLEGDLKMLRSNFERLAMELYDKDRTELEMLAQAIKRDKDRLDRTVMRSPVRGIVNKIHINTVGRVVASGADIMSIVPSDDTLLIEANIKPSDIAFIRPGEKATVKFTAYDFSIFGGLTGKVERIGADTITDDPMRPGRSMTATASNAGSSQGGGYYPITVRTDKNSLGTDRDGEELVIIPGMVAEVDILTGKRTVLDYLLKPVNRIRERALRER
jgi:adhesin transport system membrane fusion protein